MAIDLSGLPIAEIEVIPMNFGGLLTPPLGGPEQRIERVGSRWSIQFATPDMSYEPDGRRWSTRLSRAAREGALIEIPQPDLVIGNPGAPAVAGAFAGGKLVAVSGLSSGYTVREGQWVSIIIAGRRYADRIAADVTASPIGSATLQLENLLRRRLTGGEVVEVAKPMIEGWIRGDFSWPVDRKRDSTFQFTVGEAA
ncbi:MAG: hypothetical protein FJ335_13450 [Sphingomonadales bacterium]|nr:hypothetical protein [Sphingomonadales bacterium]